MNITVVEILFFQHIEQELIINTTRQINKMKQLTIKFIPTVHLFIPSLPFIIFGEYEKLSKLRMGPVISIEMRNAQWYPIKRLCTGHWLPLWFPGSDPFPYNSTEEAPYNCGRTVVIYQNSQADTVPF